VSFIVLVMIVVLFVDVIINCNAGTLIWKGVLAITPLFVVTVSTVGWLNCDICALKSAVAHNAKADAIINIFVIFFILFG
jgi:hypothetical protein